MRPLKKHIDTYRAVRQFERLTGLNPNLATRDPQFAEELQRRREDNLFRYNPEEDARLVATIIYHPDEQTVTVVRCPKEEIES